MKVPNFVWTLLAAGILYMTFSFTSRMIAPATTYAVGNGWRWAPNGFWSGRPIAPHAGYPGVTPPHPGPHNPPQFPAHGPPTPGPVDHSIFSR